MDGTVVFVLKGYPRLSETFIAQEIRGLEQRGLDITIASLRHPTDAHVHPIHGEIAAPVNYLPEYLGDEPRRTHHQLEQARREFREALFEVVAFHVDADKDGTGLGLALARRIVEVHGGSLWVESEGQEHGSTFWFTLPERPNGSERADL